MKRHLLAAALVTALVTALAVPAQADPQDYKLMPSDAYEILTALSTLGTKQKLCKDGNNEKTCTEQVKVPPGLSVLVALNLRVLKGVVEDYQWAQHKIVGSMTGGSGYLEKGSKAEAEANFQVMELARVPLTVRLNPLSLKEMEDAKLDITPAVRAVLLPILVD